MWSFSTPAACHPRTRAIVALLCSVLIAFGCDSDNGEGSPNNGGATTPSGGTSSAGNDNQMPPDTLDLRQQVLKALAEDVILATYTDFVGQAQALEVAIETYVMSGADTDRTAAQDAWRQAMAVWQQAEVMQVGPAGLMASVAGGEDLRDEIYSWPLVNRCRIDQEIVDGPITDVAAFSQEAFNVRGLDALEYLLFVTEETNRCAPNSSINRDGTWAALGADEVWRRRGQLALTIAQDLRQRAETLQAHWDPAGQNFVATFAQAGQGSELYASTQAALNALSDAMFYVEKETKDMKLATPTGLRECATQVCLDALESDVARLSKEHVVNNLRGFEKLFVGANPDGSDPAVEDLLRDIGADALADSMKANLAAAISAVEAVPGTFHDTLQSNPQVVIDAHDAVKVLTDQLKTEFISILDLELPQRAEGDND